MKRTRARNEVDESIAAIHLASGGDVTTHGGCFAHWRGGFHATTGLGAAGGRLSDDSGCDVLPRSEPGRRCVRNHSTSGASIRRGSGAESDGINELRRELGDYAAVCAESKYRCPRPGSTTGHQRGTNLPAGGPTHAADLQHSQSSRCANFDPGADAKNDSPLTSERHRSHPPTPKNRATAGRRAGPHSRRPEACGTRAGKSDGAVILRDQS